MLANNSRLLICLTSVFIILITTYINTWNSHMYANHFFNQTKTYTLSGSWSLLIYLTAIFIFITATCINTWNSHMCTTFYELDIVPVIVLLPTIIVYIVKGGDIDINHRRWCHKGRGHIDINKTTFLRNNIRYLKLSTSLQLSIKNLTDRLTVYTLFCFDKRYATKFYFPFCLCLWKALS